MNLEEKKLIHYQDNHKEVDGQLYKRCSIHKEYFPDEDEWFPCNLEHFYKNNSSPDKLHPYCKKCNTIKSHKYQVDNREHYNEYKKNKYTPDQRPYYKEISRRSRENGNLKRWQDNNKNKIKEYRLNREAHKKHKISKKEWTACKDYFNNECAYCGLPLDKHYTTYRGELKLTDFHKEHVDHMGANDLSNCIPSCKTCNSSKRTDKFEDWYVKDNPNYNIERLNRIHKWLSEDYKIYIKEIDKDKI